MSQMNQKYLKKANHLCGMIRVTVSVVWGLSLGRQLLQIHPNSQLIKKGFSMIIPGTVPLWYFVLSILRIFRQ